MTYIISAISDKSILMGSDSRLNYHTEEIDTETGESFQVIQAIADCIRKTFIIEPHNIGIQFMGIGYLPENGERFPISHFITRLSTNITLDDTIVDKMQKIYESLKLLTKKGDTGQFVNGSMTGYENGQAYVSTFNTYIDDFKVKPCQPGAYAESQSCKEVRPQQRDEVINYINSKISSVSLSRPQDVGGPIEIVEINPDGSYSWLQENSNIFNGTQAQLIDKWNFEPDTISAQFFDPPIRQKFEP